MTTIRDYDRFLCTHFLPAFMNFFVIANSKEFSVNFTVIETDVIVDSFPGSTVTYCSSAVVRVNKYLKKVIHFTRNHSENVWLNMENYHIFFYCCICGNNHLYDLL